ncbi:MAG: hypothetical protein AAB799_01300 [Patescibacteria group bacterium]
MNIESAEKQKGVLSFKIENNHYVVKLRWKNGKETEHHFPEKGFAVFSSDGTRVGFLRGQDALKILQDHSSNMNKEDFSWLNFVG